MMDYDVPKLILMVEEIVGALFIVGLVWIFYVLADPVVFSQSHF